ncbi:MAG TPA: RHS repeat-associated core domain-containing protein [Phycisphaerae bacterium]|nr:RHS repeat-associated core domain-containing protein [Phycisphaerae bacterium]HNU46204.1 RHS repeat-associated core domain-containing protein [Phycisphaerae bacterium]
MLDVSPRQHGTVSPLYLVLTGNGFTSPMQVALIGPDGSTFLASTVEVNSYTRVTAMFAAGAVPPGVYGVRVTRSADESEELSDIFEMIAGGEAELDINLILPARFGYHQLATVFVEYANRGTAVMQAPLLVTTATQNERQGAILTLDKTRVSQGLWTSVMPAGFANSVQFLASGSTPGILQPGESRRMPVYYVGWQQPWDFSYAPITWTVGVLYANNDTPVDWAAMKAEMRPSYVREDAWDVVWSNFTDQVGGTWGDYVAMLDRNALYLDAQGQRVEDITRLLALAFRQADALCPLPVLADGTDAVVQAPGMPIVFRRMYAQPISRRFELGPLGHGWTHNWQYTLVVRDDGTVVITDMTGTPRIFQPDARPGRPYLARPGDQGELRDVTGGGYVLTEASGLVRAYSADGKLDYVEDTNENRITCDYAGDLLTGLTHSSGQELDIAYTGGMISSITDDYGRQTHFSYESEHLASVQAPDGRITTYEYSTSSDAAQHALVEIGLADGVHRTFDYDTRGRLAATALDGDREPLVFSYGSEGQVTATDALGNAGSFFLDYAGRIVKTENPFGNAVYFDFDDVGQLVGVTDPAGFSSTFGYDRRGNVTRISDALGQVTRFTWTHTLNRLASVLDANGNGTWYDQDSRGNLTRITHADSSSEAWAYDAAGNPVASTNRRGQNILYSYDVSGRVTGKTYADGSQMPYLYDTRGNLVEATGANGTTRFTYDTNDYLTQIAYPAGRWLRFTYNAAGRRASSLDQTGRRLDYHYSDAGRLERMTDENGAQIVRYEYDDAGRLARKIVGNGVYTDYTYDAAWQLISLVNRAPDGTVISSFDYTYDTRGRRTAMDTHYGTWTYGYDAIDQLTSAVLVSTAPDIPDQDIRYQYDALGNRVHTRVNGVEEDYSANALNQYTQVGNRTYTYDADGNLIEESGPDGTKVYTYNDENRLVGVTRGGDAWEYTYDALGNRVAVAENGAITHYVADPIGLGNVVGEYDDDGNLLAHRDHGHGLLNRLSAGGVGTYYTYDGLGNTAEIIEGEDPSTTHYVYEPFGALISLDAAGENGCRWMGEFGVTTGSNKIALTPYRLHHFSMGRFVQSDRIGIGGGINLYTYAHNDPLNYIDPVGLCESNGGQPRTYGQRTADLLSGYVQQVGPDAANLVAPGAGDAFKAVSAPQSGVTLGKRLGRVIETMLESRLTDSPDAIMKRLSWGVKAYVGELFAALIPIVGRPALEEFYNDSPPCYWSSPPTPDSPVDEYDEEVSDSGAAEDPNEKTGPAGFGDGNHIAAGKTLAYRVGFENLESATAPAQVVDVSDPLSADLDWATFELVEIGFGDALIVVPDDQRQSFEAVVPYSFNDVDFEVHIEAGIDAGTGEAFAYLYTIDPETELPPPVDIGFLPPEDGTGRGMGHFSYLVQHESGLPSGTEIRNVATIQFDFGLTIATNQVDPLDPSQGTNPEKEALVTIDTGPPTSYVLPLPDVTTTSVFEVEWTGEDDAGGAGIRDYTIYVSIDESPYEIWLANTTDTSATFTSEDGHTYRFYSRATDNVGHLEAAPDDADASAVVELLGALYSLTVSVISGEGTVSPSEGSFPEGTIVTLTCTPGEGYQLSTWNGVDSFQGQTATVIMNADRVVIVEFEPVMYSLTVSVTEGEGTVSPGEGIFAEGTVVTVTATPAQGYEVGTWSGVDSAEGDTASVTMNSDRAVTVEFVAVEPLPEAEVRGTCGACGSGAPVGVMGCMGVLGLVRLRRRNWRV